MKNLVLVAAALLLAMLVGSSGALRADPLPGVTKGTCTLNGASPAVCTATVPALCVPFVQVQGTTAAAALHTLAASVSSTTLTVTGANALVDIVNYVCL